MDPMTISMILSLLVYLMSPKDTPEQRRRAVMGAAVAGLGTYYVTTQTEWGKELIGNETSVPAPNPTTASEAGLAGSSVGVNTSLPGGSGSVVQSSIPLASALQSYAPYAIATGAGVAIASGISKYLPQILIAVGLFFGLRAISNSSSGKGT